MRPEPVFEFHLSRVARERCRFDGMLFAQTGQLVLGEPVAARRLAAALTKARGGSPIASGADIYAIGLLDEAMHLAIGQFRASCDPRVWLDALDWFGARLGHDALEQTLLRFCADFPPLAVHRGTLDAATWLAGETGGVPHRAVALEELLLLWLGNANPACLPYRELFDDRPLAHVSAYARLTATLREYFETRPRFGPENANLVDFLRAPVLAAPLSLEEQLAFVRERWRWLLGELLTRLLVGLDVLREEAHFLAAREHARKLASERHFGGDSGPGAIPRWSTQERDVEYERFSHDEHWMPECVLLAKSTHVWLDQLARRWQRPVTRIDEVPDEELDRLAAFGVTGLWLIGLWERSHASQRIKQLCGNADAAASAYSLDDYAIAADIGGEDAWRSLRDRAAARGIRLASDMVPNHMGIDSRWVIEHPEWFLSLRHSPYPAYSFNGPDLSNDARIELKIEDHYFDRTDAAVVFRRLDRWTGETRYIYHGNDGTSFPWNDTAQLDYMNPVAREQVIQTILAVARRFPIIRFDAAMTLARRHVQRLWYPEPGAGGAIPSRAEHGMTAEQFAASMPQEFWREVVDRVATEAPGTLLLAEAFWLMEGYFVRTLGMHRVYNSAFMNMLRDEQNANYRSVIKNTLEFDPDILQRYVNFMNNPDEKSAVEQFGRGEKYFGCCTMLATLPGLPMFGHGQVEGFEEKYGMEFRRAQRIETPDEGLVAEHWRRITPLLHRRWLFSGASEFRLYDCWTEHGRVNEDVFAYSNRKGDERAVILFHNRWAEARGWIRTSVAFADKGAGEARPLRQVAFVDGLGLDPARAPFVRCRDLVSGLEHLYRTASLASDGLPVELGGYGSRVLLDWREVHEDGRPWAAICDALAGRGVPNLDEKLLDHELAPVRGAFAAAASTADEEAFVARVHELLATARACATSAGAAVAGLDPASVWSGRDAAALGEARETLAALARVPALVAGRAWARDPHACAVLPLAGETAPVTADVTHAPYVLARALVAARALGAAASDTDPGGAALRLFDALRLRRAVHDALAAKRPASSEDERWGGAALVRAALAHPAWRPGAAPSERAPWRGDEDVRWLIGVHEADDTRWFRAEAHAHFVWWRTLVALLVATTLPAEARAAELAAIEAWANTNLAAAKASAWQFDALLANAAAAAERRAAASAPDAGSTAAPAGITPTTVAPSAAPPASVAPTPRPPAAPRD